MSNSEINCELVVVGAGMAGMAATLFALNRGISTVQVGIASEIIFATGLIDLMGVHPIESGKTWENPWEAIDALVHDIPGHPYARLGKRDIKTAIDEFLSFLNGSGLAYGHQEDRNSKVITPVGTLKYTYCVPRTMWNQVVALKDGRPGLIVDIRGLKGFSARQITQSLKAFWTNLRHVQISFPDTEHLGEVYTEPMARSLALSKTRGKLAQLVRPHLKDSEVVGFPAFFGMHDTLKIHSDLEKKIGVPLFEIPTMPPSIPGLRIKELFEVRLPDLGARLLYQKKVLSVRQNNKSFILEIGDSISEYTVRAKGIILASGRFIGGGLHAGRKRIQESIFDLPVYQPTERIEWHSHDFLDPRGHLINRAGLEIDDQFRPLDASGNPAFDTLFAAGSILAHQDWIRMKCGSGLAIASAYGAVDSFKGQMKL